MLNNKINNQSNLIFAYLNKMNVKHVVNPSVDFLFELTTHHMLAFGWDTIDLYLKRKISLEPEMIIAKFIREQRGGVCYESAIAFCYLLKWLGFDAYLASAYTHGYNDHVFSYPIDTHIVIIATFRDKKYLVDVSWDPPWPILITHMNYFNDGIDQYRLRYAHSNDIFYLEKYCSNTWKKQYSFPLIPSQPERFYENLNIVINQPEYDTFKKLKIMKLTQFGTRSLFDKTFITVEHGQQTIHLIEHPSEIKKILKSIFLIDPTFIESHF
jgi:N-hydroxyarylamine O-acetyltransferase